MPDIGFAWPRGLAGACTSSWDDGTAHDRRLAGIFDRHGLKATFNLNSGALEGEGGPGRYLRAGEVAHLFRGHEVACHSLSHPRLERLPEEAALRELLEDRRRLEGLVGQPVKGMALPYGSYDRRVLDILSRAGMLYSRTVRNTHGFDPPADFLAWHPTCHPLSQLSETWEKFVRAGQPDKLFYLWGHAYEFDRDGNWDLIENFCARAAEAPGIWHATNMEVRDYVTAWRGLRCALDGMSFHNPHGVEVWLRHGDAVRSVPPGHVLRL